MEKAVLWLKEAESDLETADILLRARKFNASAFYSQQSAEKGMKALLISVHEAPWGHSVLELIQRLEQKDIRVDVGLLNDASRLDMHYIPARYPDALPGDHPSHLYTQQVAEEALACARRLMDFVKQQL